MDIVNQKFDNFKKFVAENSASSSVAALFGQVPLDSFLYTLHAKSSNSTIQQMGDEVLAYASMSRSSFDDATIERFELYIEFFLEIARRIHGSS